MKTKNFLCLVLSILIFSMAPVNALAVEVNKNNTTS